MERAKLIPWGDERERLVFYCEGCGCHHAIPVDGTRGWRWNGDTEKPTITPSILTTSKRYGEDSRCHIFVTDGIVDFLGDCTHAFAGHKRELPEVEF